VRLVVSFEKWHGAKSMHSQISNKRLVFPLLLLIDALMTRQLTFKQRVKAHFSAPLDASFKQFRWGVSLFFCGMVIVYGASQLLTPSLPQEVVVLLGLVVGGIGFVVAMLAQIRMTISRVWHFFKRPHENPHDDS
jgi:hypothetical protein